MGADLIGFMVVGPAHFSKAAVRAAAKAAQKALDLGHVCEEHHQHGEDDWPDEHACLAVREVLPGEGASAEKIVEEFVKLWTGQSGARDTTYRLDPDNPKRRILFAGDSSWGDEPDGYGYAEIKRALVMGVAEALGIE